VLVTDLHRRRELLQRLQGIALEIVGPRSSEATMEMLARRRPCGGGANAPV
jgi:hypothetical protein